MARIAREIVINAPPEAVFNYVADMPRHSEWAQHELTVTPTSDGAVGVGSSFSSVAHQFGVQRETQSIIDYTPAKRFTFDASGSLGRARHSFDLEAADGGTRLTKSMEIVQPSFMARVMSPIINGKTKTALGVDLERIKAKLEA